MKTKLNYFIIALALLALSIINSRFSTVFAQGTTAFTYQGRLNTGAGAATGSYDMTFAVWDANVGGNEIVGPITNSAVTVSNGLFTVTLDFGAGVFTGTNYWVEMMVSPAGVGAFVKLVPRQQLTPAPYALSLVSPQATALNPAGAVIAFAGTNVPNGYLPCDGSAVSRTTYAGLFSAIGTAWGAGDGSTTFNLPDMRGVFLRGVNGSRNDAFTDPGDGRTSIFTGGNSGNAVGSYQQDMFKSHTHNMGPVRQFVNGGGGSSWIVDGIPGDGNENQNVSATGGSETRPKNVYVNYIIKY